MADDDQWSDLPSMQGYLERKFKLRVCSWWRKYWFVLDGKTLLCFKNQEECETFIITRGPTIRLAAADGETREQWLDALQSALQLPLVTQPVKKRGESLLRRALSMTAASHFNRQDGSLSQPNLFHLSGSCSSSGSWQKTHSLSVESSQETCDRKEFQQRTSKWAKPDLVLDLVEQEDSSDEHAPIMKKVESDGVIVRKQTEADRLAVPPRQSMWRNTTIDFFLNEQNGNWPGLSLDLYDEVLDEIMFNVRDSGLRAKTRAPGMTLAFLGDSSDKDTQTDFSDEDPDGDRSYWNHIPDIQNELISYLSVTSLNKSILVAEDPSEHSASSQCAMVPSSESPSPTID